MPLVGSASEWWASGESLQRFLADRAAEWWVAEEDSRILGYGRSIEREGLLELTEFFVLPAAQSKGLGRALLLHTFGEFHRRGVTRISLGVDSQNATGATKLYESVGMHVEQETVVWEKRLE